MILVITIARTATLAGAQESVGRSICEVAKAFGREEMAKRWDTFPPEVRSKCINELEQAQKTGRIKVVDYRMLESCIDQMMKK